MAVCDLCKGTGRLLKPWYDTTGLMTGFTGDICFKCDGKGTIEEPLTNEEWFCGLSTTEKSEFLSTMVKEAIEVHEKHGITWHEAVSWWDGWLKGKHNG